MDTSAIFQRKSSGTSTTSVLKMTKLTGTTVIMEATDTNRGADIIVKETGATVTVCLY